MIRSPLQQGRLAAALAPSSLWTAIDVVDSTPSTNADLVAAAARTPTGAVLVAEHQVAGRGRLDRGWTSPPRAGLTFSVLLRPPVPSTKWGWLPLLAGVALCEAVGATGVPAALKWPNDLLVGPELRKAAGILAQVAGDGVVVGIGLNVSTTADELPVPTATSLALAGSPSVDREALLLAILDALGRRYLSWIGADGDATESGLAADYRTLCATLGQPVRVTATDGAAYLADAVDVDASGRLVVRTSSGLTAVAAADVEHIRAL